MNPKDNGKIGSTGKVTVFRNLQLCLVNSIFNIEVKYCSYGSQFQAWSNSQKSCERANNCPQNTWSCDEVANIPIFELRTTFSRKEYTNFGRDIDTKKISQKKKKKKRKIYFPTFHIYFPIPLTSPMPLPCATRGKISCWARCR